LGLHAICSKIDIRVFNIFHSSGKLTTDGSTLSKGLQNYFFVCFFCFNRLNVYHLLDDGTSSSISSMTTSVKSYPRPDENNQFTGQPRMVNTESQPSKISSTADELGWPREDDTEDNLEDNREFEDEKSTHAPQKVSRALASIANFNGITYGTSTQSITGNLQNRRRR
jgi:hypothetical protein